MSMYPDNIRGEWEQVERAEKKYVNPENDPQFSTCVDELASLIRKYGRRVIRLVLNNYRIRKNGAKL